MTGAEWMDLTVLERKKYNDLSEALDLTGQIGEALDRSDQVSVRMLVAMRQDPIRHLEEINQTALDRRESLAEEDQERVRALLAGAEGRTACFWSRCRRPAACWSGWWSWTGASACAWRGRTHFIKSKHPCSTGF